MTSNIQSDLMNERPASRNYRGGTHKKGQFFVISSVIILLVLYSIVQALNSNWQTDVSDVQGNDAAEVLENIEYGINRTMNMSDESNIQDHLETFILVEQRALGETYTLGSVFDITYPNVTANVTLSSDTFYANKMMRFRR